MKSKTCCFTGHRSLPENRRNEIAVKLEETIVPSASTIKRLGTS